MNTKNTQTETGEGNAPRVISTGCWASGDLCNKSPRGKHSFRDIARKASPSKGESLITSQCKYCGGLIVDCPTISIF